MAYAVEAIRWRADGQIVAVRWHSFFYDAGLRRGRSEIANIEAVVAAAERGNAIHVCYDGAPGSSLVVVDAPDGQKTIGDIPTGDPTQALKRLPTF